MRAVLLERSQERAAYRRTLSGAMFALTQPLTRPVSARDSYPSPDPSPDPSPNPKQHRDLKTSNVFLTKRNIVKL